MVVIVIDVLSWKLQMFSLICLSIVVYCVYRCNKMDTWADYQAHINSTGDDFSHFDRN